MQLYVTEEAFPAQSYYAEHWTPVYMKSDVDAALAAKDAELQLAMNTIEALVAAGFVTQAKVDEARSLFAKPIDAHQEPKP